MDTFSAPASPHLELAHQLPGRIRLRWHGAGASPAQGFLTRLRGVDGVSAVDFRPASRSLVIEHADGFDIDFLCALCQEEGIDVREQAPPPPPPRVAPVPVPGGRADYVAAVEMLIVIGLMYTWLRDMVVTRTFRAGTVLLLLLTGLSLYRRWQARAGAQLGAASPGGDAREYPES